MKNMKLEWKRGDWAAYFGLMTNNLTNLLTMMGLLIFVVGIPKEIVYGRIAPAFGLAVLVASICYAWFGMQMARATGRTDVTALPSGPSAPSIFTVTFLVLMPVYQQTKDANFAIQIALVWCFVEALILVGAGGFAYEEAAEICGVAVSTIKSRVARRRAALEQILESGDLPSRRTQVTTDTPVLDEIMEDVDRLSRGREYGMAKD